MMRYAKYLMLALALSTAACSGTGIPAADDSPIEIAFAKNRTGATTQPATDSK